MLLLPISLVQKNWEDKMKAELIPAHPSKQDRTHRLWQRFAAEQTACFPLPRYLYYIPLFNLFPLVTLFFLDFKPILRIVAVSASVACTVAFVSLFFHFQRHAARWLDAIITDETQLAICRERNQIFDGLHDNVTTLIFSAGLIADALLANENNYSHDTVSKLKKLRLLSANSYIAIRHCLLELKPTRIHEIPLEQLVAELIGIKRSTTGAEIEYTAIGTASYPPGVHQGLYRIINLALSNSILHAQASSIKVRLLLNPDQVIATIEDDGIGFDPERIKKGHFGLPDMRSIERDIGASLVFNTLPGSTPKRITLTWRRQSCHPSD